MPILIGFKMYNDEDVGKEQVPVKPDLDMEVANRVLNEYKGDHNKSHAHMDVVDEFVERYKKENPNEKHSLNVEDFYNLQFDDDINPSRTLVFKDEVREAMSDIFNQVETRKKNKKSLKFKGVAYSYNHVFLSENKGRRLNDYDIIRIMDADSLEANIHEVKEYGEEQIQGITDEIDEVFRDGQQIYRRGSDILAQGRGAGGNADLSPSKSSSNERGYNGYNGDDNQKFSLNVDLQGRQLTDGKAKKFAESEAVDEDGNLLTVYHESCI